MVGVISSTDLLVAEAEAAHKDTLRQLAEETEVRAESQCRSWHRDSSLRSE
ncbi:MAG TPA: hypothetical protein VLK88_03080 [Gemmatimonadales bacterium]|nr:hypothetical protein [Gemmatimonadales bacterium]